jgi:hypothetical protein
MLQANEALRDTVSREDGMSKIDEIKRAYEAYRRERKTYADTCRGFVGELKAGLAEYVGCPADQIKLFKPSLQAAAKTIVSAIPAGALERQGDGFWRFGVSFSIPEVGMFLYVVRIKYEDDIFELRLSDHVAFTSHDSSQAELEPFFDHMISVTAGYYKTAHEDWLAGEQPESIFELVKPKQ